MLIFYLIIYSFFYYLLKKGYIDKLYWKTFTRIISTYNALKCISFALYNLNVWFLMKDLNYIHKYLEHLYDFSSYLFVDGIFSLLFLIYNKGPLSEILSLFHHFFGSLGIYLIATTQKGFFLGWFFSMTELSTPLLNLSWYWRANKFIFICFYFTFIICRIMSLPFLFNYLSYNSLQIMSLNNLNYFMTYYATYLLIFLNMIWSLALTCKIKNSVFKK